MNWIDIILISIFTSILTSILIAIQFSYLYNKFTNNPMKYVSHCLSIMSNKDIDIKPEKLQDSDSDSDSNSDEDHIKLD